MTESGIYAITNNVNGKMYVGSAVNIKNRWKCHLSFLKYGKHHSVKLQRSWDKHGRDCFVFSILELVECIDKLIESEQKWIEKTKAFSHGFNATPKAGSSLGRVLSEETKRKISAFHKGKVRSLSDRSKQSAATKGKPKSEEHKRKIGEAHKGRVFSEEARRNMSLAQKRRSMREKGKDRDGEGRFVIREINAWGSENDVVWSERARPEDRRIIERTKA